MLDVINHD